MSCNKPKTVKIRNTGCGSETEMCDAEIRTDFQSGRDYLIACVNDELVRIDLPNVTGINLIGDGDIKVTQGVDANGATQYTVSLDCAGLAENVELGNRVLTCGDNGPEMKVLDRCGLGIEETTFETFVESVQLVDSETLVDTFRISSDCPNATGLLTLTGRLGVSAPL